MKEIQSNPSGTIAMQQVGEKNVFANQIDKANITTNNHIENINILITSQEANITPDNSSKFEFNRNYYNLFVSDDITLDLVKPITFSIVISRFYNGQFKGNYKIENGSLPQEIIDKIKTYPCLFAKENKQQGVADGDQRVGFGYVKHIRMTPFEIVIKAKITTFIPQQLLNEYHKALGFGSHGLNTTQWKIFNIDLIDELNDLNINVNTLEP